MKHRAALVPDTQELADPKGSNGRDSTTQKALRPDDDGSSLSEAKTPAMGFPLSGPRRKPARSAHISVFDAMELRYEEEGHWEDLIEMYLQRLDAAESGADKAVLFKRIAKAFKEGMGNDPQAYDAMAQAVCMDPLDEDSVIALENVTRKLDRFADLVERARKAAYEDDDVLRATRLCEHALRWCKHELGDVGAGEPFIARLRLLDPGHPAVHRRMASVHRENGVWDAQREALERALLRAGDEVEQKAILLALGDLAMDRFLDHGCATKHYDAVLALEPNNLDALRGLERVVRATGKFAKLVMILERQVDVAADDADKVASLLRLADLHERHFARFFLAAERLERVVEIDEEHVPALESLERCYRAMRDYDALARTLERRAKVEIDEDARALLFLRLAEVHEEKRGDVKAATNAYRRAFDLDHGCAAALSALARIAEKDRDWRATATYRGRLAELAEDGPTRAQIHVGIAELLAEGQRDVPRARGHYERAVEADPTCTTAWEALQRLAEEDGDGTRAANCLAQRALHAPAPRTKAQLYLELGRRVLEMGDGNAAREAYEEARKADPANVVAARNLAPVYEAEGRWQDVGLLVDVLIGAGLREGDAKGAFEAVRLATRAAQGRGESEKALRYALRSFEMRPRDAAAQEDVVRAAHSLRSEGKASLGTARATLERIAEEAQELSPEVLGLLADVARALGWTQGEVGAFNKALTVDEAHVPSLAGLARVLSEKGDHGRVATLKHRQARATEGTEARYALLLEAADLWANRVKNLEKAAAIFEEALTLKPTDPWLLHTMAWAFGERKEWEKLAGVLRRIASLEQAGDRKAAALLALAQVLATELDQPLQAAATFEAVLDADPKRLEAFERIVRIHTQSRDWGSLALAYRAMIGRLQNDDNVDLQHALFHQLGLVLRDRLRQPGQALEAFTAATRLKPQDDDDRRIVAELLLSLDKVPQAVAETAERVSQNPLLPGAYHELGELFVRQRSFDLAWCVTSVLSHLEDLHEGEAELHTAWPAVTLADVPGTLVSNAWGSHLLHPELDPRLTTVLRIMTTAVRRVRAGTFTDEQRQALGPAIVPGHSPEGTLVHEAFRDAAEIFGSPVPALYVKNGMSLPFVPAVAPGPAFFVALDQVEALPRAVIPFLVGKRIAEMRPELAAKAFFPSKEELTTLLATAVRIHASMAARASLKPTQSALLLAMSPEERVELTASLEKAQREGATLDLKKWLAYADVSSSRAGLLLAGDVDAAWRGLLRDGKTASDLPALERRAELLRFAVSEEHGELREAIGVSLGHRAEEG